MLKIQDVKELIKALDQSSLDEFKFVQDGTKLVLRKNQQRMTEVVEKETVPAVAHVSAETINSVSTPTSQPTKEKTETVPPEKENTFTIVSPMVGTFYQAPAPDLDPYVKQGDIIEEDSVVCIIEAMKLMNEIEAEIKGQVVEVLAENGELVEYGQPLVVVELI